MKLIKESFDRSVDRERRIADYRARHLSVESLNEDTVKRNSKWANVGKDGKADSGKFKTKKEADAQRKAMFANGYKGESLKEALSYPIGDLREVQRAISRGTYEYGYSDHKADDILNEIIETVVSEVYGEDAQIESNTQAGRGSISVYVEDGIYTWDFEDEATAMTQALKRAGSWDDVYEAFSDFIAEYAHFTEYEDKFEDEEEEDDESLGESLANKDADQIRDMEVGATIEFPTSIGKVTVTREKDPEFYSMQEIKGDVEEAPVLMRYPEILWAVGKITDIHNIREDVEEVEVTVDGEPMVPESEVSVEDEHSAENVPEMPQTDCKMVIANVLNPLIKDELEAIDGYNGAVSTIRGILENPEHDTSIDYDGIMAVLAEITNEENLHIGQLEKLLETVSPNAESIDDGKEEAEEQLAEVGEPEQESETPEEA